eukprot:scaffold225_cov388-Prasinococcus_capsulatus_cf.AAC.45
MGNLGEPSGCLAKHYATSWARGAAWCNQLLLPAQALAQVEAAEPAGPRPSSRALAGDPCAHSPVRRNPTQSWISHYVIYGTYAHPGPVHICKVSAQPPPPSQRRSTSSILPIRGGAPPRRASLATPTAIQRRARDGLRRDAAAPSSAALSARARPRRRCGAGGRRANTHVRAPVCVHAPRQRMRARRPNPNRGRDAPKTPEIRPEEPRKGPPGARMGPSRGLPRAQIFSCAARTAPIRPGGLAPVT